jgi:hypothetical protein
MQLNPLQLSDGGWKNLSLVDRETLAAENL